MKNQFCTYEIALKLKELGFDEECLAYYHNSTEFSFMGYLDRGNTTCNSNEILYSSDCSAPLLGQATKWLRERHNIDLWITPYEDMWYQFYISKNKEKTKNSNLDFELPFYISYYKAQEAAILKAIELCQQKK